MLGTLISSNQPQTATFTVYSDDSDHDIIDRLVRHGATVEHRTLPPEPTPFVTIHEGGEFLGSIRISDLETLLAPPIVRPGEREELSPGYQALFDLLDNTVFRSLERRQLLGASREFEDRAFRVGHGTLRVSFQSMSVFEPQVETYRVLADETALDIHIYGEEDWTPPDIDGVTYHGTMSETVDRFWVVAFDGGGDDSEACALVAQEQADGYTGIWTYDPETVDDIMQTLEETAN